MNKLRASVISPQSVDHNLTPPTSNDGAATSVQGKSALHLSSGNSIVSNMEPILEEQEAAGVLMTLFQPIKSPSATELLDDKKSFLDHAVNSTSMRARDVFGDSIFSSISIQQPTPKRRRTLSELADLAVNELVASSCPTPVQVLPDIIPPACNDVKSPADLFHSAFSAPLSNLAAHQLQSPHLAK